MTTTMKPGPIEAIPVDPLPSVGRCWWCGQPSARLIYVDTVHGVERSKCPKCAGEIFDAGH
jgi:hypothetical protein